MTHYKPGNPVAGDTLGRPEAWIGWAGARGAALALYYTFPDPIIGFWSRMGLRFVAIVGAYGSVYYGVRLILALSRERWGRPQ